MPAVSKEERISECFRTLELNDAAQQARFKIETIRDLETWNPYQAQNHELPAIYERAFDDLQQYVEDFFMNATNLQLWWPELSQYGPWLSNMRKNLEEALLRLIGYWAKEERRKSRNAHAALPTIPSTSGTSVTPKKTPRRQSSGSGKSNGNRTITRYLTSPVNISLGPPDINGSTRFLPVGNGPSSSTAHPQPRLVPTAQPIVVGRETVANSEGAPVRQGPTVDDPPDGTYSSIHSIPYRDPFDLGDDEEIDDIDVLPSHSELLTSPRQPVAQMQALRGPTPTVSSSPPLGPVELARRGKTPTHTRRRTGDDDNDSTYVPTQTESISQPPLSPPETTRSKQRKRPRQAVGDDDDLSELRNDFPYDASPSLNRGGAPRKRRGAIPQPETETDRDKSLKNADPTGSVSASSRDTGRAGKKRITRKVKVSETRHPLTQPNMKVHDRHDNDNDDDDHAYDDRMMFDDYNDNDGHGADNLLHPQRSRRRRGGTSRSLTRSQATTELDTESEPLSQLAFQPDEDSSESTGDLPPPEDLPPPGSLTQVICAAASRSFPPFRSDVEQARQMIPMPNQAQNPTHVQVLRPTQPLGSHSVSFDAFSVLTDSLTDYFTSCKKKIVRLANDPQRAVDQREKLHRRAAAIELVLADIQSRIHAVKRKKSLVESRHRTAIMPTTTVGTSGQANDGNEDINMEGDIENSNDDGDDDHEVEVTHYFYNAGLEDLI